MEKRNKRTADGVKDGEDSERHESLFLVNETLGFVIDGQTDDAYMLAGPCRQAILEDETCMSSLQHAFQPLKKASELLIRTTLSS